MKDTAMVVVSIIINLKEKTMKKFLLTILMLFVAVPVMAAETAHEYGDSWMKPVEAQYVCMMNNKVFDKPQMAIKIEGKTYYGCCPMCKDILGKDASKRSATDPVSGKPVDKATAVIGADPHGNVSYFENEENFHTYASGPMPEVKHEHMEGMDMQSMEEMHHEGMEHAH
jgi:YHS domain-containing protein